MPWARLDDKFFTHPKVRKVWHEHRPALGLHTLALSYCMCHGTEGRLSAEFVEDQMPDPGERDAAVAALVDAGLWKKNGDGWIVHDFLHYNPSNDDVEARRRVDRERKKVMRT